MNKTEILIQSGDEQGIQLLKDIFGLDKLKSLEDFASTIAFPIGGPSDYPTNTWQELNWSDHYGSEEHACRWRTLNHYELFSQGRPIPPCCALRYNGYILKGCHIKYLGKPWKFRSGHSPMTRRTRAGPFSTRLHLCSSALKIAVQCF